MSVQSEITRITGNIASAYTAVSGKGGTLPSARNSSNLPTAIQSIPSGKQEQSKTLTLGAAAPATVTPDSGKVLSSVPVTIDTSVIKAENIKKGVQMLGITGTYEGGVTPTDETWVINEVPVIDYDLSVSVWFTSNSTRFMLFETAIVKDFVQLNYLTVGIPSTLITVYDGRWISQAYRTIILDEPATGDLLTWLQANAVKQ